jgi:hypothetical protein
VVKEFVLDGGRYALRSNPKQNAGGKWCINVEIVQYAHGEWSVKNADGPERGPEECAYATEEAAHEAGREWAISRIAGGLS